MKRLLLLATVGAVVLWSAGKSPEDVRAAERAWAEATAKADFAALQKILADDLVYTHSTGDDDTKQQFIENMSNGVRKYTKVEHDGPIDVKVYGDMAIVRAKARIATIQSGKPGEAHLKWIHVFRHKGGTWQLLAHQSLRLPN
jgi:ketosteroid isomerase-like protein